MLNQRIAEVARAEFESAVADLRKFPPHDSLLRFYSRQDERIATGATASPVKPACHKNCWHCCYYKVEARAIEVFAIVDFVKRQFTELELQTALEHARQNIKEVDGFTYKQHMATNQQCPFLLDGQCAVYPVRPSKCRNFHASDVARCKESYENPTDLTIPNSYVTEVFIASHGGTEGFEKAVEFSGLDHRIYDLNSAFVEAIENPKCLKRFKDRKKAFLTAKVVQVGEAGPL